MAGDGAFRSWYALFMRMSASPGTAIAMLKLDARDRAQLVVVAYQTGLVRP